MAWRAASTIWFQDNRWILTKLGQLIALMVRKNPIDFEPSTLKVTGAQNRFSSLFRLRVITFEQIGR